ncbi:AraC family transcriptional regulator [Variovorax saccharolyticus]|uniref:AraC family transcriptional regulator n=1 Tax=Variovorax saccharolyticus TaxID=3053516 RepID=UPI002578D036|nr:AraC family transcriptional regulator [Variovorax sp. J22R187]MDM0021473.1 AraC family transcriptional regulator [Variovorax sp. J22R187]
MTSTAALPLNMLAGIQKAGIDLAELAAVAGLTAAELKKPLTEAQADRFFTAAYERVGDPAVGLFLGLQPMRPELFGVVGFSAMACSSFGAALERIKRYNALVSACELDILVDGDEAVVGVRYAGPERPYSRCRLDIQMGTLLNFGRLFTEREIVPLRLTLAGAAPPYHARYAEAFGCPALFGQAQDAIVFHRSDLDLPLVSANPGVAALFEDAAERDLVAHRSAHDTANAVREALRQLLHGDVPSIEQVAGALCVSQRTLQRRLAREGLRFSALLDEARLEMARRYLAAGRASLTEIAYLLGFADPNSFFRSFKRWTGKTPADYRHGQEAEPVRLEAPAFEPMTGPASPATRQPAGSAAPPG